MPRIEVRGYSRFHDHKTGDDFAPVLNRLTDTYIGIAEVSAEKAKEFHGRDVFREISDEWWELINSPHYAPEAAVEEPILPVADTDLTPPPAPPVEKGQKPEADKDNAADPAAATVAASTNGEPAKPSKATKPAPAEDDAPPPPPSA